MTHPHRRLPRTPSVALGVAAALSLAAATTEAKATEAELACPRFQPLSNGLPDTGEWRTYPAVGDVNGDGHVDIAGNPRKGRGPRVYLGDGKGGWTNSSKGLRIPEFTCGVGVDFVDANGDGHLDLGVADHCQGVFVFFGDGQGDWQLGPLVRRGKRRGYEDLDFGDMNGDGHPDLVAVSSFREGVRVFENDGTGNWTSRDYGLPSHGKATVARLADLNRDGRLDVMATYVAGPVGPIIPELERNVVWLSNGDGAHQYGTPGLAQDGKFFGLEIADVNGDDFLDLVISSDRWPGRPPLLVYLGDGGRSWKLSIDGLPAADTAELFYAVDAGDLNGDGHVDLAATSHMDAGLRVWMGDGAGRWQACPEAGLPGGRDELRGWGVRIADVNGDGRNDLIAGFGREGKGGIEVWAVE